MQVQLLTPEHKKTAEYPTDAQAICSLKGKHMTDDRVWEFEESLWTGTAEHYREIVDADCLMVLPEPPFVLVGEQAIAAVSDTPRWEKVTTSAKHIQRPQEGLIVVGYRVEAFKAEGKAYEAYCTSTYRRLEQGVWRVVQHQQTLSLHSNS